MTEIELRNELRRFFKRSCLDTLDINVERSAKSIEQYVTKARIEENTAYQTPVWTLAYNYATERIAQLKKGLE